MDSTGDTPECDSNRDRVPPLPQPLTLKELKPWGQDCSLLDALHDACP